MDTLTQISHSAQQYICMALATLVVAVSLSAGALMAESAGHADYLITITQIL